MVRLGQPACRAHRDLVRLIAGRGRLADGAGGNLHVLLPQRRAHVRGGQPPRCEACGIEPHPHRVLALAEDRHVGDAGNALERVAHEDVEVVAEEERVVLVVLGVDADAHHEPRRGLRDRHADVLHLVRQAAERGRHAVLHVHGREIRAAPELERGGDRGRAAVGAVRGDVLQALDAVDRLLQRVGDGRLDGERARAGVERVHVDPRRRELRILLDRQRRDRDETREDDDERADARQDGAADEDVNEHGDSGSQDRCGFAGRRPRQAAGVRAGCRAPVWPQAGSLTPARSSAPLTTPASQAHRRQSSGCPRRSARSPAFKTAFEEVLRAGQRAASARAAAARRSRPFRQAPRRRRSTGR